MLPEPLQSFVFARQNLDGVCTSAICRGKVSLNAGLISALRDLAAQGLIEPSGRLGSKTVYFESLDSVTTGEVEVTMVPFVLRKAFLYFETLEELVTEFRGIAPEKPFYIHEFKYFSAAGVEKPVRIQCYDDVLGLVEFLKSIADVTVTEGRDVILHFLVKTAVEVSVNYTAADLRLLPSLVPFRSKFAQPETRGQQAEILKSVLHDAWRAIPPEQRFRQLLQAWDGVVANFDHSYKLYLQNFSWEKLRGEVEKEKFELTKKISATISEIQTKLVAIPAAFILTATQIESADSHLKNLLILSGAFVFSALLELLLNNQRRYLDSVARECEMVRARLTKEYPTIKALAEEWTSLNEAITHQRRALLSVSLCNWSVPAATLLNIGVRSCGI
jgi:hypothetical protein